MRGWGTDRYDEANSRFSQFYEKRPKTVNRHSECEIIMSQCTKYKHICIHSPLLEPEFSTKTSFVALISRFILHDPVNLVSFLFCEVFLKLRKFRQPHHNFGGKKNDKFGYFDNFPLSGWQPCSSVVRKCPVTGRSSWHYYNTTTSVYSDNNIAFNPLNAELNPIWNFLALLGGATIVVVSRLRVNTRM